MKLPKGHRSEYSLFISSTIEDGKEKMGMMMYGENFNYHNKQDKDSNVIVSDAAQRRLRGGHRYRGKIG